MGQPFVNGCDPGALIEEYSKRSFHPQEAVYAIDCQSFEVIQISNNFENVTGLKGLQVFDTDNLYGMVHSHYVDDLLSFSARAIQAYTSGFCQYQVDTELFRFIYKLQNGRTVLRRSYCPAVDSAGNMLFTIGVITDITKYKNTDSIEISYESNQLKRLHSYMVGLGEFASILSIRELDILKLVGKGFKSRQISEMLFISKHTVDKHRKNILKKLEVGNSMGAFNKAKDMGLLNF